MKASVTIKVSYTMIAPWWQALLESRFGMEVPANEVGHEEEYEAKENSPFDGDGSLFERQHSVAVLRRSIRIANTHRRPPPIPIAIINDNCVPLMNC